MSRQWSNFFSRPGNTSHTSSTTRASEDSFTSDGSDDKETGFEFLTTVIEAPVQLYVNAFNQFSYTDRSAFQETYKKITAIEWPNVIDDLIKNHILDLIKSNFNTHVTKLLTNNTLRRDTDYFTLFDHIINGLPKSFMPDRGIFSDLFEKHLDYKTHLRKYAAEYVDCINDITNSNTLILGKKFLALISWGIPLSAIPKDQLTQILSTYAFDSLYSLITITHPRPADATYIKNIISSKPILLRRLEDYLDEESDSDSILKKSTLIKMGYPIKYNPMCSNATSVTAVGMYRTSSLSDLTLTGFSSSAEEPPRIRNSWV